MNNDIAKICNAFELEANRFELYHRSVVSVPSSPTFDTIYSKLCDSEKFVTWFRNRGFVSVEPLHIALRDSSTFFVSAGVQILDSVIHFGASIPTDTYIVAQPVTRLREIKSYLPGSQISFINLCSLSADASVSRHFILLGQWMEYLYSLGFQPEGFSFQTTDLVTQQWGETRILGMALVIRYRDIEIGDACYLFDIYHQRGYPMTISDIGFGLERILYSASRASLLGYFCRCDEINCFENMAFDALHSANLIIGSGILPAPKGHGHHLRKLIALTREITQTNGCIWEKYSRISHQWWSGFTHLTISEDAVCAIIIEEFKRLDSKS